MPTGIWKVRGEAKYFKKLSESDWGEFVNGRQVYSFKFVKFNGDAVVLRKTDGSYLKLSNTELLMGWAEDEYNRREYYGSWVNSMDDNDSGSAWDTLTLNFSGGDGNFDNDNSGACSRTVYFSGGG